MRGTSICGKKAKKDLGESKSRATFKLFVPVKCFGLVE